ncbi:universal stress protein [Amycolatopsis sp. NPDC051758]|uniref:universal stress protein n=1 Tax=Amycolatopsis sp. NPDC051758 TaxID=3363935 RepID=UPI0037B64565
MPASTGLPIVVGVDGSAESLDAVRWAARAARRRGAPLEIVYALDFSALLAGGVVPPPEEMKDVLRVRGHRYLRTAAELASAQGVPAAATRLDPDRAASALVDASKTAALVVVGASGRGRLTELLAGSVASAVSAHALCDTVIVRGDTWDEAEKSERPVLTGIDGGEASGGILETALDEAAARHAPLVVVHAWADDPPPHEADHPEHHESVAGAGHRLLAERLGKHNTGKVEIDRVVVRTHPRRELIERSGAAQLVVLGDRGRGGFPGLLLGSTGQALLHNAACPVYLVRTAS